MASFDLLDDGTVQSEGTLLDLLMNEVDSPPVMQQPAHSLNTESLLDRIKELEQSKSELESQLIMQAQQMQIQEAALPRPSQGKSLSNHTSINTYTKSDGIVSSHEYENSTISDENQNNNKSGGGETLGSESPGSCGYDSGGYDSGGYDSGYNSGGYNSDDSINQPRSSYAAILPVSKMLNGWRVMTATCASGAKLVTEKAKGAYNNKTFTDLRSATASTINALAASTPVVISEVTTETIRAVGAIPQHTGRVGSMLKQTTVSGIEVIKSTTNTFAGNFTSNSPGRMRGVRDEGTASPLSTSPLSLSPSSSAFVSPAQSPPLSPR